MKTCRATVYSAIRDSRAARNAGFTLLEVVLVMSLLALTVGIASVKLRGPYLAADFEAAIRRIAACDELTRSHAQRMGRPATLLVDVEGKTFWAETRLKHPLHSRVSLRESYAVEMVVLDGADRRAGVVTIPISRRGQSPTYALQLRGAGTGEVWLVFLGLTGQPVRIEQEDQFREWRKTLWPERPHAD